MDRYALGVRRVITTFRASTGARSGGRRAARRGSRGPKLWSEVVRDPDRRDPGRGDPGQHGPGRRCSGRVAHRRRDQPVNAPEPRRPRRLQQAVLPRRRAATSCPPRLPPSRRPLTPAKAAKLSGGSGVCSLRGAGRVDAPHRLALISARLPRTGPSFGIPHDLGAVRKRFNEARWIRWNLVRALVSTAASAASPGPWCYTGA